MGKRFGSTIERKMRLLSTFRLSFQDNVCTCNERGLEPPSVLLQSLEPDGSPLPLLSRSEYPELGFVKPVDVKLEDPTPYDLLIDRL